MKKWKILVFALKVMAKDKGMSMNELAEKLDKHQSSVSNLLSTRSSPSLENFVEIADLIGFDILGGIDDEVIEKAKQEYAKVIVRNKTIDEILGLDNDDK